MIEIFCLVMVYRVLSLNAVQKERSAAWGWLGVGCWIVGEGLGVVVALAFRANTAVLYIAGLIGACIGVAVAFTVVRRLASRVVHEASAFD